MQPEIVGTAQRRAAFRLLYEACRPDHGVLKVAAAGLVVASLLEAMGPWIGKLLIDHFATAPPNLSGSFFGLLLGLMASGAAASLIRYWQLRSLAGLAMRAVQRLREQVYQHVMLLPMSFFDKSMTGQLVSRVTNDTESVKQLYIQVLFVIMDSVITVFGVYALMIWLNVKLALLALVLIPAVLLVVWAYQRASAPSVTAARQIRSEINANLAESIHGMAVLQASNATQAFDTQFSRLNWAYYKARMGEIRANSWLLRPLLDAINLLLLAGLIFYFGIQQLWAQPQKLVELGLIYAFVNYLGRISDPLVQITHQFSQIQQAIVAASRVEHLLKQHPITEQVAEHGPRISQGKVEFKGLDFGYHEDQPVLKQINLSIEPGQFIGIVGHTGSGKSTLLSLLLRFYSAQPGQLLIDDQPIESFAIDHFTASVGLVPQEPFLLAASAFENIAMGRELTREQVEQAARAAQAHDFITKLAAGYDTPLGEGGARLSIGQKQLIAIARALAGQPRILLLDEATSHIDSETERTIQAILNQLRGQVTIISVAHRLSTVRAADQIIVMNHGRIDERGTHEQLLDIPQGIYRRLYELNQLEEIERSASA